MTKKHVTGSKLHIRIKYCLEMLKYFSFNVSAAVIFFNPKNHKNKALMGH